MDVDECQDVAQACGITCMPTFHFYRGGKRVAELCGADEAQLRTLLATHSKGASKAEAPGGGRPKKGEPQKVIDTLTKPVKWKKIIAKELKSCGGSMSLKKLRKAAVAEAKAHPSYCDHDSGQLRVEFDQQLSRWNRFVVTDGQIRLAPGHEDES